MLTQQLHGILQQQAWEQLDAFDLHCRKVVGQLSHQIAQLNAKGTQSVSIIDALTQLDGCYQQVISQYEQHKQGLANQLQRCQKGLKGVTAYQQVKN